MKRRHNALQDGRRNAVAAVALAGVIVIGTWLAFAQRLPGTDRFEVRADVATGNQLRQGDPVRIAGVNIGRVARLEPGARDGARTTLVLELDRPELVRTDASLSIVPRLLLEGNNAVDLRPGTPGAAPIDEGATIPLARTSGPVQLDQVLTALDRPVRDALGGSLKELAAGLGPGPDGTGAQGLRTAARELERTLGGLSRTATAMQGRRIGDLRRTIGGAASVAVQLGADPAALADAVTGFRRVAGAMAERDDALRSSVRELAELVTDGPRQLDALDRGLPQLDRLVAQARPTLRAAPTALRATRGMMQQLRDASRPVELPGLLRDLRPVTAALPATLSSLREAMPHATAVGRCVTRNVVPTLNKELPDGPLSTGRPAWQDMLHMAAALTGTSPGFDGNGGTLRLGLAEGPGAIRAVLPGVGPLLSTANIEGVRPAWLGYGVTPQFRPDAPCVEQEPPDLAARNRTGLPKGFQRVARPGQTKAGAERRSELLRGLLGTAADRRALLRTLLDELPQTPARRPARSTSGPGATTTPPPTDPKPTPVTPSAPTPKPAREQLQDVGEAVGSLLDPGPSSGLGGLLEALLKPGGGSGR